MEQNDKPRSATMQVDVEELYAALQDRGLVDEQENGRGTAPPPLPPAEGAPSTSKVGMVVFVAVVLGVAAAVGLSGVFFESPSAEPEATGTFEIGPIEVSE